MSKVPAAKETSHQRVIQIDAANVDGTVTITPSDEDRFNLRVREVIEACLKARVGEQAEQRFRLLLRRLVEWTLGRSDTRDAFLTTRDGALCFVVVRQESPYDEQFEDALTDLDIELANDEDIRFPVRVLSLPPVSESAMKSFLSKSFALRFHGHGK